MVKQSVGQNSVLSIHKPSDNIVEANFTRSNIHFGFQTGDIVKAVVTSGKKIGTYIGKVACRATGSFNISTVTGLVQGIGHKNCKVVHHKDGYAY